MTPSNPDDAALKGKPQEPAPAHKTRPILFSSPALIALLIVSIAISVTVIVVCVEREKDKRSHVKKPEIVELPHIEPEPDTWRFIVSGDSRNCGDIVMPAIAAHSMKNYQPSFYWHLGDLRAIYKVDEDLAFADGRSDGHQLSCTDYLKQAWPDFTEHQIAAFDDIPFYIGIGNHEVIPPKNDASIVPGIKPSAAPAGPDEIRPELNGAQFTSHFADRLLAPALLAQRIKDKDCTEVAATAKAGKRCLYLPRNYYHWVQKGVDFIYLDNASDIFGSEQLAWFDKTMKRAASPEIRSIVVGMHEALPDSISSDHAMCDKKAEAEAKARKQPYNYDQSCREGRKVYNTLLDFQQLHPDRHVYILASHSHYFLDGLFNSKGPVERLPGWIIGTAGASRNPRPPQWEDATSVKVDTYGYLLGTVDNDGKIRFDFQAVNESDVPTDTRRRYQPDFVNWCFSNNSKNKAAIARYSTNECKPPAAEPGSLNQE